MSKRIDRRTAFNVMGMANELKDIAERLKPSGYFEETAEFDTISVRLKKAGMRLALRLEAGRK
jgi:hypothetical protein